METTLYVYAAHSHDIADVCSRCQHATNYVGGRFHTGRHLRERPSTFYAIALFTTNKYSDSHLRPHLREFLEIEI